MTIRPVTSATLVSNLNQLNFEGKKKRNSNASQPMNQLSHKLAVPLAATVLAMSPMAVSSSNNTRISEADTSHNTEMVANISDFDADNGTVVASKTFSPIKGAKFETITPKISLVNTKGGSGFDKIIYTEAISEGGKHLYDKDYKISALNQAKLSLVGDDGAKSNTLTFYDIELVDDDAYVKLAPTYSDITNDMKNYIAKALKSSDNNTDIKVNNYNVGLRQTHMSLQNGANGDILKEAQAFEAFGDLEGSSSITTKNGSYTIGFYSQDSNPDDAELVTVKKEGYPELHVQGIYVNNAYFNTNKSNPQKILYGSVYLLGRDKNGNRKSYFLIDDDLTAKLISIFGQAPFKNALEYVDARDKTNDYSVLPFNKCILPHLDD